MHSVIPLVVDGTHSDRGRWFRSEQKDAASVALRNDRLIRHDFWLKASSKSSGFIATL